MMNIILITVDCLRYDRIGAAGKVAPEKSLTPNIDRLAHSGKFFRDASTAGCWTQAAFPALLTSTYAAMYNGCQGRLSTRRSTVQEALRDAGYHTVGVQTSPLLGLRYGWERGFDEYVELPSAWRDPKWHDWRGAKRLMQHRLFQRGAVALNIESRPTPGYAAAAAATDAAIALIADLPTPFFLWIHYMDVHWPHHHAMALSEPAARAAEWRHRYLYRLCRQSKWTPAPGEEESTAWRNSYDQAVANVDAEIGRLLFALECTAAEDSCIVLTADHGEEFLEHGAWGHSVGNLYQEILHVPLIVSAPGNIPAGLVHHPVSLLDLAPTLLKLAGCSKPAAMLGESLWAMLMDPVSATSPARPIIASGSWDHDVHRIAIRQNGFKFIVDLRYPERYEIYDLQQDPREQNNLRGTAPAEEAMFHTLLAQHLALIHNSRETPADLPELSPELTRQMRALGYVD